MRHCVYHLMKQMKQEEHQTVMLICFKSTGVK